MSSGPLLCASSYARLPIGARVAAALLLGASVSGCGGRGATSTPAADDRIVMSRGPCFGACPVYTVTVWGDGRVRFEGRDFVKTEGIHQATVEAAAVAELFAYADRIGFFDMPRDITPANEVACGSAWTDMPSAEVTVATSSRGHTVSHYHGCPKAPETLGQLEDRIDETANVTRWIGRAE